MAAVLVAGVGVLGLLAGSFANVAIHRWPERRSVVRPRSACPHCGSPIAARDNIPVVSFLLLGGRCRHCRAPIGWTYPAVELTVAGLWAATAAAHPDPDLPALLVAVWVVVVAAAIDLRHRIIPNVLTLRAPLVVAPLLVVAAAVDGAWADLARALICAVAVPGVMLAFSEGFRLLRGQAGIGLGDVKLGLTLGLVVGWLGGWELVVFAYATVISGAVVALGLVATGRAKLASRIPFGPYLAVGALVAILVGDPLARALADWFGV